jgi:hypothetical protein
VNDWWLGADTVAPICIAGMHRSGASMVTELLHRCGLHLGLEDRVSALRQDNPGGYWEHEGFRDINRQILETYGGGWDLPPYMPAGWHEDERLRTVRLEAQGLLGEFEGHEPWGWKDPCNSLTLPFWESLLPEVKVVVCLRNPLEAALSLHQSNRSSYAFGLNLWAAFNKRLLDTLPEGRYIVTHYAAYFYRPQVELRRVLDFLRLPASDQLVARASYNTLKDRRYHRITVQQLLEANASPPLLDLYLRLCQQAGWEHDRPVASVGPGGNKDAANRPLV